MKIAFDAERMKYPYTGLFEYCLQLGEALRKTAATNDQLAFYMRQEDEKFFNGNIEGLKQKSLHKFLFPRYQGIDVWHTTYQTSWYMPKDRKIKRVLTIHDLNFLYEKESLEKQQRYLKKVQKNVDRADHIVAISEFTKKDILENLNTHGKPVSVIYNGCVLRTFPNYKNDQISHAQPFLFSLGTVIPKKNFHVLVSLLQGNPYDLIIAGKSDENYKQQILTEAGKYGVANRVKIIGPVSNEDKYLYYKHCKAFLFPSIAEGFGIPVIEAMSFGKPVFLSTRTSLPEIGGLLAYYFEHFEPAYMQAVFTKGMAHYEQTKPTSEIIAHAARFTWEKSAEAYWQIYKGLKA